jgi:predicted DNA-binding protein
MPRHMQIEAGFEEEIDSSVTDMSEHTSTTKKRRIQNEIESVQEQRKDLSRAMDMVHSEERRGSYKGEAMDSG